MNTWTNNLSHTAIRILTVILVAAGLALAGCSGDGAPLSPDTRAALDTAPPAVPTGLSAAAANAAVKVAWLPNTTDPDFAGFMLYRLAFGQAWPLLDAPTQATSFLDQSPLNRPCSYAVAAIDVNGNESAWLEIAFQGLLERPELNRD